jgi:heat shock protein HslJ
MRKIIIILISLSFLSCRAGGKQGEPYVLWVNSSMTSCVGKAPEKCLLVQKADTMDPEAWDTFHAVIEGFEFEAGYFYKILVKEDRLGAAELAEDVSTITYTLVEIIEKKQDMKFLVQGAWSLLQLNDVVLPDRTEGYATPRLEILVGDMRYLGNDGCNNYQGGIIELDERVIRFGVNAATRMLCENMEIPDLFNASLSGIRTWEVRDNMLHLFQTEGKEVMQLIKTD